MRILEKNIKKTPWYLKPFFWNQKRKYGQILEPALIWARIPRLFLAVAAMYGVIDRKKSPLSPILRSLITVRVSQINWCEFCVDINSATLIKRAGSEAQYKQLAKWSSSSLFSPEEKAALDYAEKVTYSDQRPDDECFNQLKLYYSEQEIIELTALIAFQNMSSKFNSALGVEAQGFCSRQLTGKS
ncbi:TPA: carboxymuconolactone decarboxylase family protein [Legionella pneumophila]|uniref:carboxymuconolactone decarboxylase family protein n=1 Tax=Legionella sp. PATHC039 TaxID=2992042 RepID=UPI0007783BA9|nr:MULTISPECIES: carboxymuconolactone decarboxylase family protein [Legionella]HAT8858201.1 carboxymuconolactone decarboxylase family protein [Legionella pneumophila subsp. pneumophila]MCW8396894.1 carboxymuconolactone decarboxylase family protein [Legionella sp. PATHC039]HAT7072666.1 carboxymuconolactone decarboxylase family protein [Legionella pneumophila]HAT8640739.1 carboxymuconolactone decarboxylase family protein [Legionella pneumophila]HAT8867525.1 carboxymuconolactone decarboxylase fam